MENIGPVLVLASGSIADSQLAMLDAIPHTICREQSEVERVAKESTVILQWSGTKDLLRSAFAAAPGLRWVHSMAAGLDKILFPELVESPVVLTNGSGIFSASLGEFAVAAMLYFAKDFRRMIRNQMAGVWQQFDVEEVCGQTVGIVGYGDIGRAVAGRAHALGMRVIATKRHLPQTADPIVEQFYESSSRRDMMALCDYVVASAPLTAETRHMIGEAELAAMKPTAVVINVGRGPVIDENALIRALAGKKIKGVALDVFEHEPLPAEHPFYKLENVLLSPHCADHTRDWQDQAMRFFVQQYRRFEKGEPLKNIVNKRLGY